MSVSGVPRFQDIFPDDFHQVFLLVFQRVVAVTVRQFQVAC